MNTINQENNNNYFFQQAICDYQNVKSCIKQGLRFPEGENGQLNKQVKEDFISEKLVTNLNAGVGRLISPETLIPSFGWGSGFFSNRVQ